MLVVEDNEINQELTLELLEANGMSADLAENGQKALDCLETGTYDLVLMDCQMPILDGYDATSRIRALEGDLGRTPIVAMTASVMQEDSERCAAVGMDDFLGKPIEPARLEAVLARWLEAAS